MATLLFIYVSDLQTLVLKKDDPKSAKAGKAELKISAILIFHMLSGILGLIGATYAFNNTAAIEQDIIEFFLCSASEDPLPSCEGSSLNRVSSLYALIDASFIMVSFMPVVLLFFGMNFQTCQEKLHLIFPKHFHSSTKDTIVKRKE